MSRGLCQAPSRMRWKVLLGAALVAMLHRQSAAEAAPASQLVYGRGAGAERCPDSTTFRTAVAARFGYDPFFPWADVTITAEIRRDGKRLVGRVALVDPEGLVRGVRELEMPANECPELVTAMALAVSIALDSWEAAHPSPPAPSVSDEPPASSMRIDRTASSAPGNAEGALASAATGVDVGVREGRPPGTLQRGTRRKPYPSSGIG